MRFPVTTLIHDHIDPLNLKLSCLFKISKFKKSSSSSSTSRQPGVKVTKKCDKNSYKPFLFFAEGDVFEYIAKF